MLSKAPVTQCRTMIHQTFHCPSCGELGFLTTHRNEPVENLLDAVCHYCGHVVTADDVAAAQPPQEGPSPRVLGRR